MFQGLSLIQLAEMEANIYMHHNNQDGTVTNLDSHQYGLLQQLLETDPLLWVLNVCLQGGKTELVAFPQPVSGLVAFPQSASGSADFHLDDLPQDALKDLLSGPATSTPRNHRPSCSRRPISFSVFAITTGI